MRPPEAPAGAVSPGSLRAAVTGPAAKDWELQNPATAGEIEGYASAPSVNKGERLSIFVRTRSAKYSVAVYRMGWSGGAGAERVLGPVSNIRSVAQPDCAVTEPATGLLECQWGSPYQLQTQASWKSGVYLAKLTTQPGSGGGKDSYVLFVVRDDDRRSDLLVQVSVNTYQAYNNWGGKSLYGHNSTNGAPAAKVSLNRPYALGAQAASAKGLGAGEFITHTQPGYAVSNAAGWEYNMVRFLEREGYDVTYTTDYDVGRRPGTLLTHRGFVIMGHDEYWTMAQRNAIEAARDAGVNLGVFGSNVGFWQVRFEAARPGGAADRTMVGYKDAAYASDPVGPSSPLLTTQFRLLQNPLPENRLLGVMYGVDPVESDVVIDDATTWVTAGTGLKQGDRLVGLLGYEIDYLPELLNDSMRRIGYSHVRLRGEDHWGSMTVYTAASGATVFATGSMMWSWGLDDYNAPDLRPSRLSAGAQQITRNVLARLRAAPTPAF